jgi:hypothetical protein
MLVGKMRMGWFSGLLALVLLLPGIALSADRSPSELPSLLTALRREITTAWRKLDTDLALAAHELAKVGLAGPEARTILRQLCQGNPVAVDCATVDRTGRMLTLEPEAYRAFEGADISGQEQIVRLHRTKRPVVSRVIHAVEGFDAIDLEHPVLSAQRQLLGSVSLLLKPEALLAGIVSSVMRDDPTHLWVMQTDSRMLYVFDSTRRDNGLSQSSDGPTLQRMGMLGRQIVRKRSGSGTYVVPTGGTLGSVRRQVFWTTVTLHGTEWRLVASPLAR